MLEVVLSPWAVTVAMIAGVGLLAIASLGRSADTDAVQFTPQYLSDPANIALGRDVWLKRCKFCHGKTAYPGKAPKLEPYRYTPEFVYDRVTNGFRGMPSWKHEFSEEERRAVVAYVKSKDFSN
jgi:mono/diheme cytochrome c family protein